MTATLELLKRLAAHDEGFLGAVLWPAPERPTGLDRSTRALVELAALLACDAATESLRWAVERAAATGADDHTLVHVLETAAGATGSAQAVKSAPRLALALDLDPSA